MQISYITFISSTRYYINLSYFCTSLIVDSNHFSCIRDMLEKITLLYNFLSYRGNTMDSHHIYSY